MGYKRLLFSKKCNYIFDVLKSRPSLRTTNVNTEPALLSGFTSGSLQTVTRDSSLAASKRVLEGYTVFFFCLAVLSAGSGMKKSGSLTETSALVDNMELCVIIPIQR